MKVLVQQKKKFSIDFSKANTKFCLNLLNADNSYLLMEKKYLILKPTIKMLTFQLGSISNGFSAVESREVSLNGNVNDFSVDYNSIDKYDIINTHKCLMTKNNIK